jgi:hypothetical protein
MNLVDVRKIIVESIHNYESGPPVDTKLIKRSGQLAAFEVTFSDASEFIVKIERKK